MTLKSQKLVILFLPSRQPSRFGVKAWGPSRHHRDGKLASLRESEPWIVEPDQDFLLKVLESRIFGYQVGLKTNVLDLARIFAFFSENYWVITGFWLLLDQTWA